MIRKMRAEAFIFFFYYTSCFIKNLVTITTLKSKKL